MGNKEKKKELCSLVSFEKNNELFSSLCLAFTLEKATFKTANKVFMCVLLRNIISLALLSIDTATAKTPRLDIGFCHHKIGIFKVISSFL